MKNKVQFIRIAASDTDTKVSVVARIEYKALFTPFNRRRFRDGLTNKIHEAVRSEYNASEISILNK